MDKNKEINYDDIIEQRKQNWNSFFDRYSKLASELDDEDCNVSIDLSSNSEDLVQDEPVESSEQSDNEESAIDKNEMDNFNKVFQTVCNQTINRWKTVLVKDSYEEIQRQGKLHKIRKSLMHTEEGSMTINSRGLDNSMTENNLNIRKIDSFDNQKRGKKVIKKIVQTTTKTTTIVEEDDIKPINNHQSSTKKNYFGKMKRSFPQNIDSDDEFDDSFTIKSKSKAKKLPKKSKWQTSSTPIKVPAIDWINEEKNNKSIVLYTPEKMKSNSIIISKEHIENRLLEEAPNTPIKLVKDVIRNIRIRSNETLKLERLPSPTKKTQTPPDSDDDMLLLQMNQKPVLALYRTIN